MPRNFSFNHLSGMCRNCWGLGFKTVNLHYLPAVKTICPECRGYKLNPRTFDVKYQDLHLGEILQLTVAEAKDFFASFPKIQKKLELIIETGLEYLKMGQELNSLSTGEQQRLRLVKELSKRFSERTLYVFDEPTVGLHFDDIGKLLKMFERLSNRKNTLIIIEHNLSVIMNADYLIELGPKGGEAGGRIIFQGTVGKAVEDPLSITGRFLKPFFNKTIQNASPSLGGK